MSACEICGGELAVGQRRRHFTCCAKTGGRPEDVCRSTSTKVPGSKVSVEVCAHCWVPSTKAAAA